MKLLFAFNTISKENKHNDLKIPTVIKKKTQKV